MPDRLPAPAYRMIFDLFDGDSDGRVSGVELRALLHRLGSELVQAQVDGLMATVDDDRDGRIDFSEFLCLVDRGPCESDIRATFRAFDLDGDGFISAGELRTVLGFVGIEADSEVDAMVAEIDADGDGQVSYDDLKAFSRASYSAS